MGSSKRERSLQPENQTGLFWSREAERTYGKNDICYPSHGGKAAPFMPGVTSVTFRIDFPTTKLLVQPPAIVTVPHFEVGKPLSYDRYESCIHPNANAYSQSRVYSATEVQN